MQSFKIKTTAILTAIFSAMGSLFIPLCLLLLANIIDYITGIMASPKRGQETSSYRSIKGIKKKVSMWLLVVIGGMVDVLLMYATDFTTFDIKFSFVFANVTALWLVCNEGISSLENLGDIGINLPPFLMPLLRNIRKQTEDKTEIESEEQND